MEKKPKRIDLTEFEKRNILKLYIELKSQELDERVGIPAVRDTARDGRQAQ